MNLIGDVLDNSQGTCRELKRGSDTLVIVFNSWTFRPGRHEFYKTALKRGFDGLWISDMHRLWFLLGASDIGADSIETLTDWLREKAAPYRRVVCIGMSMAASAAMLYGAALRADLTVGFGPQACLRARGGLTQMFTLSFLKQMYDDVERLRRDPGAGLLRDWSLPAVQLADPATPRVPHLVFVPPGDIRDLYDAWRLRAVPGVRVFVSERDQHPGVHKLIEAGIVADLFDIFDGPAPVAEAAIGHCARLLPEYLTPEGFWSARLRRLRYARRRHAARRERRAAASDVPRPGAAGRGPRAA